MLFGREIDLDSEVFKRLVAIRFLDKFLRRVVSVFDGLRGLEHAILLKMARGWRRSKQSPLTPIRFRAYHLPFLRCYILQPRQKL